MKLRIVLVCLLFLTACKTNIGFQVEIDDFSKPKPNQITGLLEIEVTTCIDSETKIPSDDVFKLQNKIPFIFKGAKYLDCRDVDFNSTVQFELPAYIDNIKDGKPVDDNILNFTFDKSSEESRNLVIHASKKLRNSINNLINSTVFADFNKTALLVVIDPGKKDYSFDVVGAYLSDTPIQFGSYGTDKKKFSVKIPSYGIKQIASSEHGSFIVLSNVKEIIKQKIKE